MADVTLLFGIGATKAGTSWLHAWLADHPEVHLWRHKELHYFDAHEFGNLGRQVAAARDRRTRIAARRDAATDPERITALGDAVAEFDRYLALMATPGIDPAAYLRFLTERRGTAHVVGDVTPAYALLPVERLRFMAALNPVSRFVYLLRDPVERLWSNVRAMAGQKGGTATEVATRATRIFDRWTRGEEQAVAARSDYGGALRRLFAAVPERSRHVGFYEDLFGGAEAARISAFLGIANRPAPVDRAVNQGPAVALDPARRAIAAERLAAQYDEVKSLIGRVPDRWQPMGVEV